MGMMPGSRLGRVRFGTGSPRTGDVSVWDGKRWARLPSPAGSGNYLLRSPGGLAVPAWIIGREVLTANRTYYVRTDGNDSNTGLVNSSGGAFATGQKAIDTAAALDLSIYNVTIQFGPGTFSTTNGLVAKQCVGAGTVTLLGDEATPSNVVLTTNGAMTGNGDACFLSSAISTIYSVRGARLNSTATGTVYGLTASSGARIDFQNLDFGTGMSQHIRAEDTGIVRATGPYRITGGAASHFNAVGAGIVRVQSRVITVLGALNFSSAFAFFLRGGVGFLNSNTIDISGATVTGKQYDVTENATVATGGGANYFPGNVAGTVSTGGQYN